MGLFCIFLPNRVHNAIYISRRRRGTEHFCQLNRFVDGGFGGDVGAKHQLIHRQLQVAAIDPADASQVPVVADGADHLVDDFPLLPGAADPVSGQVPGIGMIAVLVEKGIQQFQAGAVLYGELMQELHGQDPGGAAGIVGDGLGAKGPVGIVKIAGMSHVISRL